MDVTHLAKLAKKASRDLMRISPVLRKQILQKLAKNLLLREKEILAENAVDIKIAQENNLPAAKIDRLKLTPARLAVMVQSVFVISEQEEVVGIIEDESTRPNGLVVKKERVPLGVIAMIFEGRPNVVVDCAALALKSGNAILLKGGSEAQNSNRILVQVVRESLTDMVNPDCVILVDSIDREETKKLMTLNGLIDVLIPRGGAELIQYVSENATVPVIAHYKGLCHIYVDKDVEAEEAIKVCLNAKAQRVGVCNAMETLLVHQEVAQLFLGQLIPLLAEKGIELRGCKKTHQLFPTSTKVADDCDWETEYLDKILSIKIVDNLQKGIEHIQKYGSQHTEGICSSSQAAIETFQKEVDASCIVVNASTRFNDGGELGLGAELGISTSKLHAYGPMGAKEMTTLRFLVVGSGHIRT